MNRRSNDKPFNLKIVKSKNVDVTVMVIGDEDYDDPETARQFVKDVNVSCVVVARNERKYIKKTLRSLRRSTVPLFIVVVDDGSYDKTLKIAKPYADVLVEMPCHEESYAGRPELAERWNAGLKAVPPDSDYVMLLGADHPLPKSYVARVVAHMIRDNVIVGSGRIKGEKFTTNVPRPSGTLYYYLWFQMIGFYPVNWGWENYPVLKAMSTGYKTRCYTNIVTRTLRKVSLVPEKMFSWGKGLKALGYTADFVLEVAYDLHSIEILEGYYQDNVPLHEDIAGFVRKNCKDRRFEALFVIAELLDRTEQLKKEAKRYRKKKH